MHPRELFTRCSTHRVGVVRIQRVLDLKEDGLKAKEVLYDVVYWLWLISRKQSCPTFNVQFLYAGCGHDRAPLLRMHVTAEQYQSSISYGNSRFNTVIAIILGLLEVWRWSSASLSIVKYRQRLQDSRLYAIAAGRSIHFRRLDFVQFNCLQAHQANGQAATHRRRGEGA